MNRQAGILMPISSLPSSYGIGCFSEEAYEFVDFLHDSGQCIWQILPLCPTSIGDSPYQSPCSFAGNPYFISPDRLAKDLLLTSDECVAYSAENDSRYVDYGRLYERRFPLLRLAYSRFSESHKGEKYSAFLTENSFWLYDYALYCAIKKHLGDIPLSMWHSDLRRRDPSSLNEYRKNLSEDINFYIFLQYEFFTQWNELKSYANSRGIKILGDLPIYVCADSSDVWVSPELFELDGDGIPLSVAGCPPDGFSPMGQLWGNPLYNWSEHKRSRYAFWVQRMSHAFKMYDIVRIDHFRGFESYYSIPYGAPDARGGHWEKGAGRELFSEIEGSLGKREIIAEDLGYITDGVRRLVKDCGFQGMKILQFGFDSNDFSSEYLPVNYEKDCVVYTGTHDNPTLKEWLCNMGESSEKMVRDYICDRETPKEELAEKLIAVAQQSAADICIIPIQDYLSTGHEGRMNTPSSSSGNWIWRAKKEDISKSLCKKVKHLTKIGNRLKF